MKNVIALSHLFFLILCVFHSTVSAQIITVSSENITTTSIKVNRGEVIAFEATGDVSLGFFVGSSTPDGLIGVNTFKDYNLVDDASHGALLARVQGGTWQVIGAKGILVADKKGKIQFIVNDNERSNNSGSYRAKVVQLNNKWLKALPDCPCTTPNRSNTTDGWAVDVGDLATYHPGATICFRSYPAVRTAEGQSGQQCCYDISGNLITGGAGAGTPDKQSSCNGEDSNGTMNTWYTNVPFHYFSDVRPFNNMALVKYLSIWKPNNDNGCPVNIKP